MTVETHATTVEDLVVYKAKNPIKFTHKFGDLDFNNLPANFGSMIPYYKKMVVSERVRRESQGNIDISPITPWMFAPWKVAEVKAEPVAESVVAPVVEPTASISEANTAGQVN